jgi:pilus assembly protein Flp/PilA
MLKKIKNQILLLRCDEEGQGLVEYGLLLFLIAVVCVTAITGVGTKVNSVFTAIQTSLTGS